MTGLCFTRRGAVAVALVFLGVAACGSDTPKGAETFCSAAKAGTKSCADAAPCDATLVKSCGALDKVLSPSTLSAAQECLDSGICSSSYCLTRAQKSAVATDGHKALAAAFCAQCAPDVADCQNQFYAKQGDLPGSIVLPYADAVASAVKDACTADLATCRAKFASCATDTIAATLGQSVDADTATCITADFQQDDSGGPTPSGGPAVLTCTSRNCKGCCRDDRCVDGTTGDACGLDATACETCGQTQKCTQGQCIEPCGPNNCKGCCDGDSCLGGAEKDKCGGGGAACNACSKQGASFICSNQTCIDGACSATCVSGCCGASGCQPGTAANACGAGGEACIDCGYGHACGDGQACQLDHNSTWSFVALSAVVPTVNKAGNSWDLFGGLPDVYLNAFSSVGSTSHTGKTTTKDDTLVPSWVEAPLAGIKASELINNTSFELWDYDALDPSDLIGGCAIAITPDVFNGQVRQVVCPPTASNVSVTLKFKIVKP